MIHFLLSFDAWLVNFLLARVVLFASKIIMLFDWGVSLVINVTPDCLPAITDEVIQAAYQQGREEMQHRNPEAVVATQRGSAFHN